MKTYFANCKRILYFGPIRLCIMATMILLTLLVWSPLFSLALAKHIYIDQTPSGDDTGANCANAHSMDWLNTSNNWGTGGTEVSAGDTVHLCGTLTSSLRIQGNGSEGAPITILFESGANFSAPYWSESGSSGAIVGNGHNYITIDGGTNGIIECTDNGTAGTYTYQVKSRAIIFEGSHDIEIKNLTIRNLYRRVASNDYNDAGTGGQAIRLVGSSNLSIHDCSISNSAWCAAMYANATASSNFRFYNNTVNHTFSAVWVAVTSTNSTLTGFYFYNNNCQMGTDYNQDNDSDYFHAEYIHPHTDAASGTRINKIRIYNNFFGGVTPKRATASAISGWIFDEAKGDDTLIYNNVFEQLSAYGTPTDGLIGGNLSSTTGIKILNNTFVRDTLGGKNAINSLPSDSIIQNNIFVNINNALTSGTPVSPPNVDYNVYSSGVGSYDSGTHSHHGTKPTLDTNYAPTAADTLARDGGVDLSAYFTTDKNGVTRPAGSAWDIGAYEYGGVIPPPSAPRNLRVVQ